MSVIYQPVNTRKGGTIIILVIPRQDLLATLQSTSSGVLLNPWTLTSPKPKDAIARLAEYPETSSVLFPIFSNKAIANQKQALRISAGNYNMSIQISNYDDRTFLIENVTKDWRPIEAITVFTPAETYNVKLARARNKGNVVLLPDYTWTDYLAYIDTLMMHERVENNPGCGVLIPRFGSRGDVSQRAQIAHWATIRHIKVSISTWDDENYIMKFKSYIENYEQKVALVNGEERGYYLSAPRSSDTPEWMQDEEPLILSDELTVVEPDSEPIVDASDALKADILEDLFGDKESGS